MESGLIIDLVYQALRMAALLAGPTLLALLIVGLVLGILQAATSINESTVAFVPKLVIFGLVILLAGPVTLALFVDYIQELLVCSRANLWRVSDRSDVCVSGIANAVSGFAHFALGLLCIPHGRNRQLSDTRR
ncbi:MAG: hypothetical protein RIR08_1622 [Pseudomonadota bacterium]